MTVRVVFADDNYLVREGLAALLADAPEIDLVETVSDPEALHRAVAVTKPDAVLTDIRMPPTFTTEGIDAAKLIRAEFPGTGVVVLSQNVEEVNAGLEALREITRGVFPMQLARSGLQAALHSFPLVVGPELEGRRFPARTEAAIYFACTQTGATSATLGAAAGDLELTLSGVTTVPQQVVDRVEASGGSLRGSDGLVSVLLPDLQQPVGVERGLGDVRRGAGP